MNLQGAVFADTPAAAQGSDAEITDRVTKKLAEADKDVAQHIRVSTANGVVTLEGNVFTKTQMLSVLQDARGVPGVTKVTNHLSARM
jgi:osmotically-inducible protein OsmY